MPRAILLREVGEMLLAVRPGSRHSVVLWRGTGAPETYRRLHPILCRHVSGVDASLGELQRDSFFEMVQAGKESYYIVSQFDLFEYAQEAPFFGSSFRFVRGLYLWAEYGARGTGPAQGDLSAALSLPGRQRGSCSPGRARFALV